MIDINELIRKDEVSGEDIGRLIICNDVSLYMKQTGCGESCQPQPVTQEILDALTEKIETIDEAEKLECYVQLQRFVQYAQAMSFAYNQQAQNGFSRLLMYMTQAQQVEHARRMIELLPMIMTERQFSEMRSPGKLARMRGVAVVANSFPCRPKCLDAHDNFIEPEIDCFQEMMSLEQVEHMADKIKYFRDDLLLNGMKYQAAYNRLFELIAERIEVPEFRVFSTDISDLIRQIDELNVQRKAFDDEIAGEGEEYNNKKRILKDVFLPIDVRNIFPTENAENKVREQLKDISIFRTGMTELVEALVTDGG